MTTVMMGMPIPRMKPNSNRDKMFVNIILIIKYYIKLAIGSVYVAVIALLIYTVSINQTHLTRFVSLSQSDMKNRITKVLCSDAWNDLYLQRGVF